MAAILGDGGVGTATIPPPAGPEKAASSREEIDFQAEADARGMRLVSCTRVSYRKRIFCRYAHCFGYDGRCIFEDMVFYLEGFVVLLQSRVEVSQLRQVRLDFYRWCPASNLISKEKS